MSLKVISNSPENSLASYEWGKVINFGIRGNAGAYCASGWSEPEPGLVWTNSINSRLSFSITPPTSNITLVLNCSPFIARGIVNQQELHLYVNFMRLDLISVTHEAPVEVVIPKHIFAHPECHIDFYIPTARSPAELGLNPDIRCLGFAMSRLVLIHG